MNKKFNLLSKTSGRGNTYITFSVPYNSHKADADGKEHTIYSANMDSSNEWAIAVLVHDGKGPRYESEGFITEAVNQQSGELYDWLMSQI